MLRKEIIGVVVLGVFLIVGAVLSQRFSGEILYYLDFGLAGMAVYVAVGIIATVIAPVSALPLLPIAVTLWGPFMASLLSIFGWGVGSIIAFLIARSYGRPLVGRFVDMEKIGRYEKALTGRYLFWDVVLLRMAVPVDILSYAIGLFSSMKFGPYVLATIIGTIPFVFVFAYASQTSLLFQLGAVILVAGAVYLGYRKVKRAGDTLLDENKV